MIKRVELLHDIGNAKDVEDVYFADQVSGVFGVFDGVSMPYSVKHPIERFGPNHLSSGAVVVREVVSRTLQARVCNYKDEPLRDMIVSANHMVRFFQAMLGVPMDRTDMLPGAVFAAVKVGKEKTEILQCGDSMALWVKRDGSYWITRNQVLVHKSELWEEWRRLKRKHRELCEGNLVAAYDAAWEELMPAYTEWRRVNTNNRASQNWYGLLNGQPQSEACWFSAEVPTNELVSIFLFTDGLVSYEDFSDENDLARYILTVHRRLGSLGHILESVRYNELLKKEKSLGIAREATAIAVHLA